MSEDVQEVRSRQDAHLRDLLDSDARVTSVLITLMKMEGVVRNASVREVARFDGRRATDFGRMGSQHLLLVREVEQLLGPSKRLIDPLLRQPVSDNVRETDVSTGEIELEADLLGLLRRRREEGVSAQPPAFRHPSSACPQQTMVGPTSEVPSPKELKSMKGMVEVATGMLKSSSSGLVRLSAG